MSKPTWLQKTETLIYPMLNGIILQILRQINDVYAAGLTILDMMTLQLSNND